MHSARSCGSLTVPGIETDGQSPLPVLEFASLGWHCQSRRWFLDFFRNLCHATFRTCKGSFLAIDSVQVESEAFSVCVEGSSDEKSQNRVPSSCANHGHQKLASIGVSRRGWYSSIAFFLECIEKWDRSDAECTGPIPWRPCCFTCRLERFDANVQSSEFVGIFLGPLWIFLSAVRLHHKATHGIGSLGHCKIRESFLNLGNSFLLRFFV